MESSDTQRPTSHNACTSDVDYWQTFDPAKYDFYNPSRDMHNGFDIENHRSLQTDNPQCDPYDPGTPPPLSPIKEMDDDIDKESERRSPSPPDSVLSHTFESRHADLDSHGSWRPSVVDRTQLLFSRQHLRTILADQAELTRFTTFLKTYRPGSVPMLVYYLQIVKGLKALRYTDAIIRKLQSVPGKDFTMEINSATLPYILEDKLDRALETLTKEDLPAFVAYCYVTMVDSALVDRVIGRQNSTSSKLANGLAEVFVLSDPARPDNPIVFSSEDFHLMTGFTRQEFLGKNCRSLGGPKTDPAGIARFKASLQAEREHCEVLLNYQRNGSPFLNLIMCVPLRDQSGKVRYYLGAQLDITDLVVECTEMNALRMVIEHAPNQHSAKASESRTINDSSENIEWEDLSQVLDSSELERLVARWGSQSTASSNTERHRRPVSIGNVGPASLMAHDIATAPHLGFYQNYLLVRPYPSLRILFASPSLRATAILQSRLLSHIGGSVRVRDDLSRALECGRKVTAKVQWQMGGTQMFSAKWIHCTPLLGVNNAVGVWMVILIEATDAPAPSVEDIEARNKFAEKNPAADAIPWAAAPETKISHIMSKDFRGVEGDIISEDESTLSKRKAGQISQTGKSAQLPMMTELSSFCLKEKDQALKSEYARLNNGNKATGEPINHIPGIRQDESILRPGPDQRRPVIKIAGRPPADGGLSSPADVAANTRSMVEPDKRRPGRRTYKSLSPYGIIIDD